MTTETITATTCAVEDCKERGRPQVCPFDGRYHHHGRIHYTNNYGYPERFGFRFRSLSDTGWLDICNKHYAEITRVLGPKPWEGAHR